MNSATDTKATEPDDTLIARADERLAHAYEQIAQADEQLARVTEQLSKLERATSRPSVLGRGRSRGRLPLRGLIGLVLAACVFAAAFVAQSHGEAARLIIARWAPQLVSTSSSTPKTSELSAQPTPSGVHTSAAETVVSHAAPSAQTAPPDAVPTSAPMSPEVAQLLQTITRDLADVKQEIEQLKTSQAQIASDNARTVEQLKASQEQMARAVAKVSEQKQRPTTSAPPPRPVATAARKPAPAVPPQQTRARP
jgi:septal ring factor EnvC (AmiA/AmiB activator)